MPRYLDPNDGVTPRPWTATVVDTIARNPYFSVLLQDVTVTDGSKRAYYTIDFPSPAVGVVARRGSDILLVRQYRFIVDEFVWAIPSGGTLATENLAAAALRELEEETGYTARSIEPLLHFYASYGCSNQAFYIYVAPDVSKMSDTVDANEVIEVRWFTREEALELVLHNGIVDSLSLSPLLYVLLQEERSRAGR